MRAVVWAVAILAWLLDLGAWGLTIALAWIASAPGHETESARAVLVGTFAFCGLFAAFGAALLVWNVEEAR